MAFDIIAFFQDSTCNSFNFFRATVMSNFDSNSNFSYCSISIAISLTSEDQFLLQIDRSYKNIVFNILSCLILTSRFQNFRIEIYLKSIHLDHAISPETHTLEVKVLTHRYARIARFCTV